METIILYLPLISLVVVFAVSFWLCRRFGYAFVLKRDLAVHRENSKPE